MAKPFEADRAIRLLRELGLNQLEAEVYTFLLPEAPMTAYRIGKHLDRPTANVYKAIESLARQGAVLIEEGTNRLCRAVPVAEFLRHRQRGFLCVANEAQQVLSSLQSTTHDERVYQIQSVSELFERGRSMLEKASKVAVVDAFPRSLAALRPAIEASAERGVEVLVEAYEPTEIIGAQVAVVPAGDESVAAWRSEQLNLVVDGRELLVGMLSADMERVYQAIWSQSTYLACLLHSGRLSEHTIIRLHCALGEDPSGATLPAELGRHRFFRDSDVPGHRELIERFLSPTSEEKP